MTEKNNFSLQKTFYILAIFFMVIYAMIVAKDFLIPLAFSILFALVLLPLSARLEKVMPRPLAIILCLLLILILIVIIGFIFYSQIRQFSEDMDLLKQKFLEKSQQILMFVQEKTGVSTTEQKAWLEKKGTAFLGSSGEYIKTAILGFSGFLAIIGIIIIYIFFFLFYRERFRRFIMKLFPLQSHPKVAHITSRTKSLVHHYLTGLLLELFALGTLNAIGLSILGIKQAIFFGYLAGFLNIIPYVGSLIGGIFPVLMALLFKDSMFAAVGVVIVLAVNQFIDNNFLTPKIIGSHIQINPLATIMIIILGGLLWGIPGMILFIPLLGIIKIICDNIESLQPFGYLLGEKEDDDEVRYREPKTSLWERISGMVKRKKEN